MLWSLRCAQHLQQLQRSVRGHGWRAAWATANHRGQMAVLFIVLIALIILMGAMTMNLGEVARLKTSTANAADAGALAGASWVASGTNEAAYIARGLWINVYLVQLILLSGPFWCIWLCVYPVFIVLLLWAVAEIFTAIAEDVMEMAFENAKGATLFSTIQNLAIDDNSDVVRDQLKLLAKSYEDTEHVPTSLTLGPWMRRGADGVDRPSRIEVNFSFSKMSAPSMEMRNFSPFWICLSPPITIGWFNCSYPLYAYISVNGMGDDAEAPDNATMKTSDGGGGGGGSFLDKLGLGWMSGYIPNWTSLLSVIANFPYPEHGTCQTCFPFIIILPVPVIPQTIDDGEGDITVSVRQFRSGGSQMRFWQMLYPAAGILSQATAHYNPANVGGGWGKPTGRANLKTAGLL
jgi:hypothetical protein